MVTATWPQGPGPRVPGMHAGCLPLFFWRKHVCDTKPLNSSLNHLSKSIDMNNKHSSWIIIENLKSLLHPTIIYKQVAKAMALKSTISDSIINKAGLTPLHLSTTCSNVQALWRRHHYTCTALDDVTALRRPHNVTNMSAPSIQYATTT